MYRDMEMKGLAVQHSNCGLFQFFRQPLDLLYTLRPEQVSIKMNRTMAKENLEKFRQLVLEDLSLQEKLRDIKDREAFVALTVRLGEERGCVFYGEDVEDALDASRRAWLERWL